MNAMEALQIVANDCHAVLSGDDMSGMNDRQLFGAILETVNAGLQGEPNEAPELGTRVRQLERTVGWLILGLAVPMVLLGLVVGLTLFG